MNLSLLEFSEVCDVIDEEYTIVFILVKFWESLLECSCFLLKVFIPVSCIVIRPGSSISFDTPWIPDPQKSFSTNLMCIQYSIDMSLCESSRCRFSI